MGRFAFAFYGARRHVKENAKMDGVIVFTLILVTAGLFSAREQEKRRADLIAACQPIIVSDTEALFPCRGDIHRGALKVYLKSRPDLMVDRSAPSHTHFIKKP